MDILQRATQLLRPFMPEERRNTWLTLAFHAEQRDVYDAIPQSGATADFTVRCVSRLLDRGCLGSRHALSVLLDVVRSEAGEDRQEAFRALIEELDHKCAGIRAGAGASAPAAVPAVPGRDLVYISYRHRDRAWHDRLRRVLDADPRLRGLIWDDTEIPGGADWEQQIHEHVPRARIMIMLASDDYFDPAVSGAFEPEIKPALQAHANGEIAILWMPVRPLSIATSPVRHITSATGSGAVPLELLAPEEQAASLIKVYREVLRLLGMPGEPVGSIVLSAAQSPVTSRSRSPNAVNQPQIPGAKMTATATILFLAASPEDQKKLALDKEAREIRSKIRASKHRDSLEFKTEWAVRPGDLLQYLNELKPQAVHFGGHGDTSELILNDEQGKSKPVSATALRALFDLHKQTVRLVVLNACYSKPQAKAIVKVIDCAVGMKKEIGDDAAIVFAAAFYGKLGFGASVQEAFKEGLVALMMEGIPEEKTPELLVKNGVDPARVFLVGPDANPG
jgi:hypothetical protein